MPGLIDGKFRAVWQPDRCQQAPALIGDLLRDFGPLAPQLGKGGADVIAHQVQLMTAVTVGWMNSKLGRGQRENEPASACIYRRHAEHVREERTDLLSVRGKHDRMHASDHAAILTADQPVTRQRARLPGRSGLYGGQRPGGHLALFLLHVMHADVR
jgi:hypothetical protein